MADEEIPENVDLRFVAAQLKRVLGNQKDAAQRFDAMDRRFDGVDRRFDAMDRRFAGVDQRFDAMDRRFAGVDRRLSEMEVAMAATRADLAIVKDTVEKIYETQQNHGARLNAIDGRLAIIEEHTGLVKA
jgi:hypothetical protein